MSRAEERRSGSSIAPGTVRYGPDGWLMPHRSPERESRSGRLSGTLVLTHARADCLELR